MTEKAPSAAPAPLSDSQVESVSAGGNPYRYFSEEGKERARNVRDFVSWPFRKVGSLVSGLFT